MKKFLSVIIFMLAFSCGLFAQSTTPRFGIVKNDDNTGRVLTYKFVSTVDATGADTIKLNPSAFETLVVPSATIKDSLSYAINSLTSSYVGDVMVFNFTNSSGSGHKIKFVGTGWQFSSSGSSIALTTVKRAAITFRFDGVAWVETGRMVQ
jgi:hypothetical protein